MARKKLKIKFVFDTSDGSDGEILSGIKNFEFDLFCPDFEKKYGAGAVLILKRVRSVPIFYQYERKSVVFCCVSLADSDRIRSSDFFFFFFRFPRSPFVTFLQNRYLHPRLRTVLHKLPKHICEVA